MARSTARRPRGSRTGPWTALLVLTLLSAVGPSVPAGASESTPSRTAGEQWYGYLTSTASGTRQLSDGGTYINQDAYSLAAPDDSAQGQLTITIDTVETHPDPDPMADGCWTKRQTWTGTGVVPASFRVQSNVGGSNYQIDVDALAPIQVNSTTQYGGTLGGQPCSEGNLASSGDYTPWLVIHSGQNPKPNFRGGSNTTLRPNEGVCEVVSECTDMLTYSHVPATIRSKWSVAARECTGYSRSYRLGKQDTLFVFNPCQTKSLSSRVNFLQEISGQPKICDYAFVKRVSQACNGYKAVTRIQWGQNDWFMAYAARNDACGVWVVDRADWRPPKVRPAQGTNGLAISSISYGTSQRVETASGSMVVSCP